VPLEEALDECMSPFMYKAKLKAYSNCKRLEFLGLGKCTLQMPKYPKGIEKEAKAMIENSINWDTFEWVSFQSQEQDYETHVSDSSSSSADSTVSSHPEEICKTRKLLKKTILSPISCSMSEKDDDSQVDNLLDVTKWRLCKQKVQLLCSWEVDKTRWDNFECLQIDYPEIIGTYISANLDCYIACKKHEMFCKQILQHTKNVTDQALRNHEPPGKRKINTVFEVPLIDCSNDHKDLGIFNDYGSKEWFKEGTALYETKCNECKGNISDMNVSVHKPVKMCKNNGSKGCCVCICNGCWMDMLLLQKPVHRHRAMTKKII
jgi:hypothetical protein